MPVDFKTVGMVFDDWEVLLFILNCLDRNLPTCSNKGSCLFYHPPVVSHVVENEHHYSTRISA